MVLNSSPAKQSACTSVISVNTCAEPSILLDKNPVKVVTEAKFLGVIFDKTLSYSSHVNYLKINCLKALDILKIVGHADWGGGGRSESSTMSLSSPCKISTGL